MNVVVAFVPEPPLLEPDVVVKKPEVVPPRATLIGFWPDTDQ